MCIAQAHTLGSYFNLPLAWPSSQSHCYSMAKLQTQDTLTTLEQCVHMIQQLLPDQLLNSQPKIETNNAKHTNLLGYEAKELMIFNGCPEGSEKCDISCAYELAILGNEPSHAFLI